MRISAFKNHRFKQRGKSIFLFLMLYLGFAGIAFLGTFSAYASISEEETSEKISAKEETRPPVQNIFASLSGFQPNAVVVYKIYDPQKARLVRGRAQTDSLGNLTLPMPPQFQDFSHNLTYDFLIDQDNQTLSIALSYDAQTEAFSLKGSGTQEFTRIIIESDKKSFETHSDWAGLFEESEISHLWSGQDNPSYKIAFFNTDPTQGLDALTRSPIIQINTADGGGGPGSSGVNEVTTSDCDDPQISFCDSSRMDQQMDDIVKNLVEPLQLMAEQLTFNAMYQTFVIGTFMDAKEQLEAQRDVQALVAEANKDYQPSEQLCRFGSFTKSLAHTEQKMESEALAFNKIMMDHYLNKKSGANAFGNVSGPALHLQQFREVYCNPADHARGLDFLCEHDQDNDMSNSTHRNSTPTGIGGEKMQRMNKDIDFLRTLETPYTLDINFTDNVVTDDEEDVVALAKNLYWPSPYEVLPQEKALKNKLHYMSARRLMAINNIAHTSFAHQLALKSQAPVGTATSGWAHMKTMMREFGLKDEEIDSMMGQRPSYYAQMDFLTKKIYQNPNFYTNLYDKPANVDRILAVLDSISLMQQRDHYESMLRNEMLTSGMVQMALTPTIEYLQTKFDKAHN